MELGCWGRIGVLWPLAKRTKWKLVGTLGTGKNLQSKTRPYFLCTIKTKRPKRKPQFPPFFSLSILYIILFTSFPILNEELRFSPFP